jgi:uncharacterized YigZ family protein
VAHRTLARRAHHEDVIKGSRFVAVVAPLEAPDGAEALVTSVRAAHPEAGHVCWATLWGEARRWSDDGEPGGTAGRPMLEVLEKRGLDRVVAAVARRFGGVKLGAGGLARAYGGAIAKAVDAAGVVFVPDRDAFRVAAPFADADALMRALQARVDVVLRAPDYGPDGVVLTGTVLREAAEELAALVADLTRGRGRWRATRIDDGPGPDGTHRLSGSSSG